MHVGLFDPAAGLVGFGFPFGDCFNWEAGGRYFGLMVGQFFGEADGACKRAIRFFVETGADGFDGGGQEIVVVGDGEGEAGFNGGELG